MKQYIDKSAVVAEIEKRLKANGAFDEVGDEAWAEDKGMCEAYRSILSFLDTLEVKEVEEIPVSNDLEEAAASYPSAIHMVAPQWSNEVINAFKAGAKWMEQQLKDK